MLGVAERPRAEHSEGALACEARSTDDRMYRLYIEMTRLWRRIASGSHENGGDCNVERLQPRDEMAEAYILLGRVLLCSVSTVCAGTIVAWNHGVQIRGLRRARMLAYIYLSIPKWPKLIGQGVRTRRAHRLWLTQDCSCAVTIASERRKRDALYIMASPRARRRPSAARWGPRVEVKSAGCDRVAAVRG